MKQKETIRSLWTLTAGMLSGTRRTAMLLLTTLLLTMTAQTARANYDWYDTSITIGGITADFSQWSRGNGAPDTDLGFLNSLTISGVELKIWDDSNDRGGINMFFRLYGDNGQIGGDVEVWLGGAERIEGSVHDFSVSYTGPFDLADAFGVILEPGMTYYLTMWAKSYGDDGDHWYNGDGDNYHTKFTYISNDDVWDLSTKTLTVKSNPANEAYKNRLVIENVIISDGVTSIGKNAFANCTGLTSVTVYAPDCTLGDDAFDGCSNLTNIYVFSDKVNSYKSADNWSTYADIITAMPNPQGTCGDNVTWELALTSTSGILTISGTGAMADYDDPDDQPWKDYRSSITKVVIGNGVTSIGNNAFTGVEAKFATIVTQDNFYSFFDESGNLLDNVTFGELIFQGEFSGLAAGYVIINKPITITGDNAVLNNMGFVIAADEITLNNMSLVANGDLSSLIYVSDYEDVTLDNVSVTYNAPADADAKAIFAEGAENFKLINSEIIFTGANPGSYHYRGLEVRDCDAAKIDKNTITATFPAVDVDYSIGSSDNIDPYLVLAVGIQDGENVEFTNNSVTVNTNGGIGGYPSIDAVMICSANDILIKGNNIHLVDNSTEGNPTYYYSLDLYCINGTVEANTISVNTTTDDDVERVVAYPI